MGFEIRVIRSSLNPTSGVPMSGPKEKRRWPLDRVLCIKMCAYFKWIIWRSYHKVQNASRFVQVHQSSFSVEKTGQLQSRKGLPTPALLRPRLVLSRCSLDRLFKGSALAILSVAGDHRISRIGLTNLISVPIRFQIRFL